MSYVGDVRTGARVEMAPICTTDTSGVPTAATSMSICVRRAGQALLAPAGVVMTTSGASYFISIFTASASSYFLTANDYAVFVGNGTVGSTLIAGYPVGSFSIENRSALMPTVAARTLSVDATGRVELIAIAGATVSSTTGIMDINVRQWMGQTPLALTAQQVQAATTSIGLAALQQFFTTSTGVFADAVNNSIVKQIPNGTWDVTLASHLAAGSTGEGLNSAGAAGDPWATAIPGAYAAGTAGNKLGNAINATTYTVSADVVQIGGSTQSQADLKDFADTGYNPATHTLTNSVDANLTTWRGTTPNVLIAGRVDANAAAVTVSAAVLTLAAGSISSTTFAASAIDAAALATDAVNEIADGILARSLAAESYAADGAVPTLSQMQYMIFSALAQFAVISTSIVTYQLNGTSTAMTFSIDSATTPTLRIRTG